MIYQHHTVSQREHSLTMGAQSHNRSIYRNSVLIKGEPCYWNSCSNSLSMIQKLENGSVHRQ
uniref:Uncharacterized protein n=1 Tax=Arion vulgaris TaxID=1028688 RepID=A0A0B7AVD6_9EUPU